MSLSYPHRLKAYGGQSFVCLCIPIIPTSGLTYWEYASNDYALIWSWFSKSEPLDSLILNLPSLLYFQVWPHWSSLEGLFVWFNPPLLLAIFECYIYQGQWVLAGRQETQSVDRATASQSCQYNSCSLLTVIWLFSKPLIWNTIEPFRRSSWGLGAAGCFPSIFFFSGRSCAWHLTLKWFGMPELSHKEWSS